MRQVTLEERSWKATDLSASDADAKRSADPVTAAIVSYTYARV